MKNRKLFAIITLVAFMLTMMPMMAFAATSGESAISVEDGNAKVADDCLDIVVDVDGTIGADEFVIIFAERNGNLSDVDYFYTVEDTAIAGVPGSREAGYIILAANKDGANGKAFNVAAFPEGGEKHLYVSSASAGTVTFKAYVVKEALDLTERSIAELYNGANDLMRYAFADGNGSTGKFSTTNNEITAEVTVKDGDAIVYNKTVSGAEVATINDVVNANNGVDYFDFSMRFLKGGSKLVGEDVTVSIDKNGATVNKEELTTSATGKVDFKVSASKPGTYTVTVECGTFSQDFKVTFGAAQITKVDFTFTVDGTIAVDNKETVAMQILAYDANGNALAANKVGADADGVERIGAVDGKGFIVEVVSAPEDSTLEEEKLLIYYNPNTSDNVYVSFTPDAVGTYTIKVYSEITGVADTTTIVADEFGVIDHATISYPSSTYALGAKTPQATVNLYDQNGVKKSVNANKTFSYSGLGVASFDSKNGNVTFKSDSEYAGNEVVVSVVANGKYAASTTLTVGAAPAALQFTAAQGEVGEEVTVNAQVVDVNGNATAVAVPSDYTVDVQSAIIVERPEGATVSVDADYFDISEQTFLKKGTGKVVLTSNKEGTVKANVVLKLTATRDMIVDGVTYDVDGTNGAYVFYLTGLATATFGEGAVDATGADDVVTFIIGSSTFIANNKATTSDVAPYIVDGRTFIPVRAFVEATGATIEYDAATQVVTIKGNGIDAQMTIGSNILTVNGETVVMDTAAAIKDGRTVLPVRYAGQAIGYDFECAYGANGAVTAVTMFK